MNKYEMLSQLLGPDVMTVENRAFANFAADVMGIFENKKQLATHLDMIYNSMWLDLDRKPTSIETASGIAYSQIITPLTKIVEAKYLADPDNLYQEFYDAKVGSELFLETVATKVRNILDTSDASVQDAIGGQGADILNFGYNTLVNLSKVHTTKYLATSGRPINIDKLQLPPDPRTLRIMNGVDLTHQYMLKMEELSRQVL